MPDRTILPPPLVKGDRVGLISPAGPVSEEDLFLGIQVIEDHGFEVRMGKNALKRQGYLAGTDQERLNDLHAMFMDRDIKAILCTRGGYGTMRLLDKIDFTTIRKNPKIFAGYSDITALLMAIHGMTGLLTFHTPMPANLTDQKGLEAFLNIAESGMISLINLKNGTCIVPGIAEGKILGGNLTVISHLIGTPFIPSFKDCILFVEDRGESIYRIDRMLVHLRLSGHLNDLKGFVAGTFEGCGDQNSVEALLKEILSDMGFPVVTGLPVGHGMTNHPVPVGAMAVLDTYSATLAISCPITDNRQ